MFSNIFMNFKTNYFNVIDHAQLHNYYIQKLESNNLKVFF